MWILLARNLPFGRATQPILEREKQTLPANERPPNAVEGYHACLKMPLLLTVLVLFVLTFATHVPTHSLSAETPGESCVNCHLSLSTVA